MPEISKLALNAGELSDELAGRIDLSKFNSGCEVLENATVLRAGGVTRRSGFKYMGAVQDEARKTRLVGFRFAETQGYVLELGHLTMRVIHAGEILPTVYVTPWTEDQVFDLQFAQRVDRIVVTHPEIPVQNIIRYTDGTWGVIEHPWQTRVWERFISTTEFTLTPAALTGTTTITSSPALFDGWEEGDRIRIDHAVGEDKSEYSASSALGFSTTVDLSTTSVTEGDVHYETVDGLRNHYRCIADYNHLPTGSGGDYTGATSLADYPTFFEVGAILVPETTVKNTWVFETFGTWRGTYLVERSYNGGTTWNVIKVISSADNRNERLVETETEEALIRVVVSKYDSDITKRVEFTVESYDEYGVAVVDSVSVDGITANVTVERPFESTDASTTWYEEAFSPRNGYPRAVTFYQGRICFGGTALRPQTIWLSQTQNPFDFTFGTLATDAMAFYTDAEGYESVLWLSSHLSLLVGTTLGVWAISSPEGTSLNPESNSINKQMQVGAERGFQAVPLENNVIFLQDKGRKVQELTGGSIEYGGYLSADLTQLATHVTRGGVTQFAPGRLPDSALFMVSGGEISVLTYERRQNVVGWARWKTDGDFESFTTTAGAQEEDDRYAVVKRGSNRYIVYQAPDMLRVEEDDDVENLRFLDLYSEKVEVTEFSSMTGLDRFDGEEVEVFIDGEPQGTATVAAGEITLSRAGKNVVVGLPYTTEVRPMPIDFGSIGSKSSMYEVLLRFRNTLGGETSQDRVNWSKIEALQPRITDDVPLCLLSTDAQSTPHSTRERKPSISVRQTQPLPMTLLAMRIKTKSTR